MGEWDGCCKPLLGQPYIRSIQIMDENTGNRLGPCSDTQDGKLLHHSRFASIKVH